VIELLIGLAIVVVGTVTYVALRNAQDFSDANEVIPGHPTQAPKGWAGAHSPEARLHRRLRDSMTSLRANRSLDEPALVPVREALEREALAVDDRLVAAAALPKGVRDEPLAQVTAAVEAIEQAVADVVGLRGPGAAATEQAIAEVRTRLALVEEARAELDALGGVSPSLEELRRSIEAEQDDGPAGGAPGAQEGPR
jgi:hypothetical protein